MNARAAIDLAIAEAEDPKSVFKQIVRPVWIGGGLWILMPNRMRRHQLGHVFFYTRQEQAKRIDPSNGRYYYTPPQGDDKWHMRDVIGEPNSVTCQQAFDTEEEAKAALLELVKRKGLISSAEPRTMRWRTTPGGHEEYLEAEDPKDFLRRHGPEMKRQQIIRDLTAKFDLQSVPPDDAFREGQRVRRTRLNVFGARPFGGEPNDIGDLGTVVRFVGRDDVAYAKYLVRWDRHPLGTEYMDHRALEAA